MSYQEIKSLKLAVVGHIEWVSFINVNKLPVEGEIVHGHNFIERAAGGGAVAAAQMSKLTSREVHFFTSLGKDEIGKKCYNQLGSLGIKMNVAWRDKPTRRGFSFVDINGDRAITIIGERLQPLSSDHLPWETLGEFDGIFLTAADAEAIKMCRQARILCSTPRVRIKDLNKSNIQLDSLISSNLDPDEKYSPQSLKVKPKSRILTEGKNGGMLIPGGRYQPVKLKAKAIDSYGCGDSFAAGVTTGLAANMNIREAIQLGAKCGAECAIRFGPYNGVRDH